LTHSIRSLYGKVQIAGTAVLCLGVATITDRRNRIPPFLQPAFIGSLLAVIGMAFALNAGYAINPARDFGPRLFTLCAGYGWRVFSYRSYKWFWIPIICPMLGALLGAWIYEFFIGFHIPDDPDTTYIHKVTFLRSFVVSLLYRWVSRYAYVVVAVVLVALLHNI
ncbi:aquaporin-9 domain protein, partial [Cooperia oncophora]